MSALKDAAIAVRENAHAPYSKFKVGAAIRSVSGAVYVGCNVENVAYPEGTCAEAGAIAAIAAAGEYEISEAYVVAGSPMPVTAPLPIGVHQPGQVVNERDHVPRIVVVPNVGAVRCDQIVIVVDRRWEHRVGLHLGIEPPQAVG